MKHNDLIKVFCKALGLYFVIQAAINIKDTIFYGVMTQFYEDNGSSLYLFLSGQIVNFLFNGFAAWILISKSDLVTRKILKGSNDTVDLTVKKSDLIELVIVGISGLIIIYSIPEIMNKVVSYVYINPYDRVEKNEFWTSKNKADIFYSIFKLVIGLLVITNARQIAKRLTKIGDRDEQIESGSK